MPVPLPQKPCSVALPELAVTVERGRHIQPLRRKDWMAGSSFDDRCRHAEETALGPVTTGRRTAGDWQSLLAVAGG
jgi:hypothetical protein